MHRTFPVLLFLAIIGQQSIYGAPLSTTGWDKDVVLGNGETHGSHGNPITNNYIWFTTDFALSGGGGLDPSGAVTAGGIDFQFQPFTGGASNALVGNGTIALVTPGKFSEISLLGSATGGTSGNFVFNFAGGTTATVAISGSFPNWANGASQISPNPRLTNNGTSASFNGAIGARTFDLTNLNSTDYSGLTLNSISLSGVSGTTTALFALSGVSAGPDETPPTLPGSDIVDDQNGGPVNENTVVTYTLTFSEDIDDSTVDASDFSNAGTSPVNFGNIVETAPGVFSVPVTPTAPGTLRLQVNAGAIIKDTAGNDLDTTVAILDDTTLDVVATPVDTTPPTPNPMTFAVAPYASSTTAITMEASIASDPAGVEYLFKETSGNPGGSDSGWQSSPTYQDTGLSTGLTYTYTVTARDLSANLNATAPSAGFSAIAEEPQNPPSVITLTSPTSRHIVQRSASDTGAIVITGTYTSVPTSIQARAVVMSGAGNSGSTTDWQTIEAAPSGANFTGTLTAVPAGGWYQIEVRGLVNGAPGTASVIQKVGVGDIFVTAGQSNSANHGSGGYTVSDDRVSARSAVTGSAWVPASDPMPIATGTNGSAWTRLGDQLAAELNIPIGFIALGVGSTQVSAWLPGTSNYNNRLKPAIQSFPANGFRALLWHQGESDSIASVAAAAHASRLASMIGQSRTDAGWSIPWYLAEASFHPNTELSRETAVAAGQRAAVHSDPLVFLGPSTDGFHLENASGGKLRDGVHFNAAGLLDHATQWQEILMGAATVTPKNPGFEDNFTPSITTQAALADGANYLLTPATNKNSPMVLDWRILSADGSTAADGTNGIHNPTIGTYAAAIDSSNDGILPNMSGKHVALLEGGTAGNYFLHSTRALATANTTYALTVALGVRDQPDTFGNARLEITANGVVVASATFDKAVLDALRGSDASGTFTDATVTWTSTGSVADNQPLAIRIVKEGGADTVIDFDNVRFTASPVATTQKTTIYEAEDAVIVGGTIQTWGSGYSGTGVVSMANDSGDSIEWTVTMGHAGPAKLYLRYALGGSDRPLELRVNGQVVVASLSFLPTGDWTQWSITPPITVALNAGENTVRVATIGSKGPRMDYLRVVETLPLPGEIMTVYDGANLTGTTATVDATHVVYSGAGIPGGLDNQISSFVLSEGYMAVVADPEDGTNPSKVYIAADGPLTVNSLPPEFDNAISFLRVVPWINTLKKGFGGGSDLQRAQVDHSWHYDWTKGVAKGQQTMGPEFVTMCFDKRFVQLDDYLAQDQITHLLSFNEPDGEDQANMPDILEAVAVHKELQKAGLRLGSPACREEGAVGSTRWLDQFMTEADAQGVRVDTISLHWYDWGSSPATNTSPDPAAVAQRLKTYLSNVYKRYRKPIWITEFNANPNRARNIQDDFLQLVLPYLEDCAYVERYAYFQPFGGNGDFLDANGELTSTGMIYSAHESTTAYLTTEVPSEWRHSDIGGAADGDTLYNGAYTIVGSGTGVSGTSDGCRLVWQTISGDATITAKVTSQIWRNNLSLSGVMIRESLNGNSKQATMALSMGSGARFLTRSTTGGSTATTSDASIPRFPYWVRLVRQGDVFTGYHSPDGIEWTQLGSSRTIAMGSEIHVGMVVTSHNDGNFNDAIFKDVTITPNLGQSLYLDWTRRSFAGAFTDTQVNDNPDGDAFNNLQEFAFGMDPSVANFNPLEFVVQGEIAATGAPTLMNFAEPGAPYEARAVFTRRKDHAAAGLVYTVHFSADLKQWTPSNLPPTVLTDVNSSSDYEVVSIAFPDNVPVDDAGPPRPARFMRTSVSME